MAPVVSQCCRIAVRGVLAWDGAHVVPPFLQLVNVAASARPPTSTPPSRRSAFDCFKDSRPDLSADEIGRQWINMEESDRSVFEELLRQTRNPINEVGTGDSDDYSARCEVAIRKIR